MEFLSLDSKKWTAYLRFKCGSFTKMSGTYFIVRSEREYTDNYRYENKKLLFQNVWLLR